MTLTRVSSKPTSPEAVLAHVEPGADIVMPNANGEPVELVNTLEEHAEELSGVRIHQMQALRERRYINGEFGDHLRYVSYFLSPACRKAYLAGQCDLMPNHFSEVPTCFGAHQGSCDPLRVPRRTGTGTSRWHQM